MERDYLLFTSDMSEAVAEIESLGGCVITEFSENVLAAHFADSIDLASLTKSGIDPPAELDHDSRILVEAWEIMKENRK